MKLFGIFLVVILMTELSSCNTKWSNYGSTCFRTTPDTCGDNMICVLPTNTMLIEGVCYCDESKAIENPLVPQECHPYAEKLHEPCFVTKLCTKKIPGTYCSNQGKCECSQSDGYYEDSTNTGCAKYAQELGHICESDETCELIPGSYCNPDNTKCTCNANDGYFEVQGHCFRPVTRLHDSCEVTKQCRNMNAECRKGKCECKSGFQEYLNDCIDEGSSVDLHENCHLGMDSDYSECPENAYCSIWQTCECLPTAYEVDDGTGQMSCELFVSLHDPCQTDEMCGNLEGAICTVVEGEVDATCECDMISYVADAKDLGCVMLAKTVGDSCRENPDEQCGLLNNATCSGDICECDADYLEHEGECFPKLGELNELCIPMSSQCTVQNSFCSPFSSRCECEENFIAYGNDSCIALGGLGEACDSMVDGVCGAVQGAICSASEGKCVCDARSGYVEDKEGTFCARYALHLGDTCSENPDEQCSSLANSECRRGEVGTLGICQCKKDFLEFEGQCLVKVDALHDACVPWSLQCAIPGSSCSPISRECECANNFMENNGACLPYAHELGRDCTENWECEMIPGASCIESTCECDARQGYFETAKIVSSFKPITHYWLTSKDSSYQNQNYSYCSKYALRAQDICSDDPTQQCQLVENSTCDQTLTPFQCVCNDNFVQSSDGQCLAKVDALHEACIPLSLQCAIPGSFCSPISRECECANNFMENNGACLPYAHELGRDCTENWECEMIPGASCIESTCECDARQGYFETAKIVSSFKPITHYWLTSKDSSYQNQNYSYCAKYALRAQDICSDDPTQQCQLVENSTCNQTLTPFQCVCNDNFVQSSNGQCLSKISELNGEACVPGEGQCELSHSYCSPHSETCTCVEDISFQLEGKCELYAETLGNPCPTTSDQQCMKIPHATCKTIDGTGPLCECKSGYLPSSDNRVCLQEALMIGDTCENTDQCQLIEKSSCESGRCLCDSFYLVPSYDGTACLQKSTHVDEFCEEDAQCQLGIGADALCNGGKCECRQGTVANEAGNKCLQVAGLNEACEDSKQCTYLAGELAECNASGNCACLDGAEGLNGVCHLSVPLDGQCTSSEECQLGSKSEFAECTIRNICECNDDSYRDIPNGDVETCRKKLRIGSRCDNDSECAKSILGPVYCEPNNVCACIYGLRATQSEQFCSFSNAMRLHGIEITFSNVFLSVFTLLVLSKVFS